MSKDDEIMELKHRLNCVITEKHALEDIAARKQKTIDRILEVLSEDNPMLGAWLIIARKSLRDYHEQTCKCGKGEEK